MSVAIVSGFKGENLTGLQVGRWEILSLTGLDSRRNPLWLCRCRCGTEKIIRGKPESQSCGCLAREMTAARNKTHGLSHLPEYIVWQGMKLRCNNPNQKGYHNYGGRGIKVCDRWSASFEAFWADMGSRPSPNHTLERKDNDRGYEPENCVWATKKEQRLNQRDGRLRPISYNGETMLVAEWAARMTMPVRAIIKRLQRGWPVEKALTTPLKETYPIRVLARLSGMTVNCLRSRLNRGWSLEKAILTPVRGYPS